MATIDSGVLSILYPGDLLARGCRQRGHQLRLYVRQHHGKASLRGGKETEELQRIQKGHLINKKKHGQVNVVSGSINYFMRYSLACLAAGSGAARLVRH